MTAITVDAIREKQVITGLNPLSAPVAASTRIYRGTLVGLNAAGYLISALNTSACVFFLGVAAAGADNSAVAVDGKIKCKVYTRGEFKFTLASVAITDVGKHCFVLDNDTVALTTANGLSVGKITKYDTTNTCWVDIGDRLTTGSKTKNIPLSLFCDSNLDPLGGVSRTRILEIPLQNFLKNDLVTELPTGGDNTNLGLVAGTHGSASPTLQGADAGGATKTETARVQIPVPDDYLPATDLTITCHAGMLTTVSDGSATLDFQVFEGDEEAGVGSDLCATAAQSINSTTLATKTFTITGAGLVAGDTLDIEVTTVVVDTGDGGVMKALIGAINITYTKELTEGDGTYLSRIPGTHGTGSPYLRGSDAGGTTATELARALVEVPADYAGGDITLRVKAEMETTVSDTTATLDAQVYEGDGEGGVGSDLCETAAQSINSLTAANKDFTIDGDAIAAGDILDVELTTAVTDTGDAAAMRAKIGNVQLIYTGYN